MKKLFFMALVLATSVAQAAEVTVLETNVNVSTYRALSDARFYIDQNTHEGSVKVSVAEERPIIDYTGGGYPGPYPGGYYPYPRWNPAPVLVTVFEETVKVDGLMLMGDKVVYHAPEGSVDCGTMGVSRVFKKPTLFLTGKCELTSSLNVTRRQSTLKVTLKTK